MRKILIGTVIVAGLIVAFLWKSAVRRHAAESARWRAQAAALEQASLKADELRKTQNEGEQERARAEHSELLRLRSEVAALRRQLRDATNPLSRLNAADRARRVAVATNAEPLLPVINYEAKAAAYVPTGHSLVAGGWLTEEGKRVLVMMSPDVVKSPDAFQILVQAKWVEMPEAVFAELGLAGLAAGETQANLSQVMDDPQYRVLLRALDQVAGVDVLSAPRLLTGNGTPAQISVTERKIIHGESFDVGPTLDLTPRISPDGAGIYVDMQARLSLLRKP